MFEEVQYGGLRPGRVLRGVEPMIATFETRGALGAVLNVFLGEVVTLTFTSVAKAARTVTMSVPSAPVYEQYTVQGELEQSTPPGYGHDTAASESLQIYGLDIRRAVSTDNSSWKFTTHVNLDQLIYARGYGNAVGDLTNYFADEREFVGA